MCHFSHFGLGHFALLTLLLYTSASKNNAMPSSLKTDKKIKHSAQTT